MAELFQNLEDIWEDVLIKLLDSVGCSEMKIALVELLSYFTNN